MSRSGVSFLPSSWEATRSLLSSLDSLQRRLSVRRQSSLSRWDFCQGLGRAITAFVQPIFHKQEHRVIEIFLLTLLGHATVQHLLLALHGNSICSRNTPANTTKGTKSFFYHCFPLPSLQEVLIHLCFTGGTNLPRPNTTSQDPRAEQHDQKKQTSQADRFRAVISFPRKERRRFNASCFSIPSLAWQPRSMNGIFVGTAMGARCPREQWWGCPA